MSEAVGSGVGAAGSGRLLGWPRVVLMGTLYHYKNATQSLFFILTSILQPVIFASIAFFMFREGGHPATLLYAALGAGLMGIWSTTLFGCGGAIQWQRFQGTLEMLVVAPAPLPAVLLGITLATAGTGAYAMLATLIWGWLLFGVPLTFASPLVFLVAVVVTVVSLGLLGLVLASSFVLYRHANALSNLLEYPVWLVSGLLVPISLLPGWSHPIGYVLAPTWGVMAVRAAALGGNALGPIAACIVLSLVYLLLATVLLQYVERLARRDASLSLT
jgi:ABC-2 type transport system permease protein